MCTRGLEESVGVSIHTCVYIAGINILVSRYVWVCVCVCVASVGVLSRPAN